MDIARQFCTFFLDNHYFGVDVLKVQEVIRFQEMTQVPLASPFVRGLINLRGQVVMALDLRRRFGMPDRPADQLPVNIVVRTNDGAVSLLVDEIGDVIVLSEKTFEPLPESLRVTHRELIDAVYKLNDRLMLVLNTDQAVRPASERT